VRRTKFIQAHSSGLAALSLSLSGRQLASASDRGTLVRIYSTADGSKLQVPFSIEWPSQPISTCASDCTSNVQQMTDCGCWSTHLPVAYWCPYVLTGLRTICFNCPSAVGMHIKPFVSIETCQWKRRLFKFYVRHLVCRS
jgi:hypothetical protein